ncbi:hypothetical protein RRG08_020714 [Elysia crispata]|uniref:Uncharacterized protein n=1 Tax=Elysia crispata TaxID=231223 RepID=A0AAE1E900_9GAST|nr:hypothetical protein RRG08_020714 [Elysia crispata]
MQLVSWSRSQVHHGLGYDCVVQVLTRMESNPAYKARSVNPCINPSSYSGSKTTAGEESFSRPLSTLRHLVRLRIQERNRSLDHCRHSGTWSDSESRRGIVLSTIVDTAAPGQTQNPGEESFSRPLSAQRHLVRLRIQERNRSLDHCRHCGTWSDSESRRGIVLSTIVDTAAPGQTQNPGEESFSRPLSAQRHLVRLRIQERNRSLDHCRHCGTWSDSESRRGIVLSTIVDTAAPGQTQNPYSLLEYLVLESVLVGYGYGGTVK